MTRPRGIRKALLPALELSANDWRERAAPRCGICLGIIRAKRGGVVSIRARYCSDECRAEARRLSAADSRTRRSCAWRATWLGDEETVCPYCERLFLPKRPTQRCCSRLCGSRWSAIVYAERRQREREAARPATRPCAACGVEMPTVECGKTQRFCAPCVRERRRERARLDMHARRAGKRAARAAAHITCADCNARVPLPPTGAPPQRCQSCAAKRNAMKARERDQRKSAKIRAAIATLGAQAPKVMRAGNIKQLRERRQRIRASVEHMARLVAAHEGQARDIQCRCCGEHARVWPAHRRYCAACRPEGADSPLQRLAPVRRCRLRTCRAEFQPLRHDQAYCSPACAAEGKRRREALPQTKKKRAKAARERRAKKKGDTTT